MKKLTIFALLASSTLCVAGCVTVPSQTAQLGQQSTATQPSATQPKALPEPQPAPVRKGFDFPIPDGAVDGDEFMANFKIEEYSNTGTVRSVIKGAAVDVLKDKKFQNDFERNKALANFDAQTNVTEGKNLPLPKYLILRFPFGFKSASYSFENKQFGVTPAHRFLPDNLYPKQREGVFDDAMAFRPYFEPIVSTIRWNYPKGNFAGQYLYGARLFIKLGHFSQNWGGSGSTNLVNYVKASPDQFEQLMREGKRVPRSNDSVYFIGYGIYKVNPSSLKCMGGRYAGYLSSIGSFGCEIEAAPYQYVLKNFMGNENYVINVKTIKLGK